MSDSTATHDPSGPADELAEVLDRYLADLRAGHAPDRAELLARYGHLAGELDPCLAGIDFIHRAAEPVAADSGQLGEFRIIRELGRGGMGVVYEAEQTSLKRRVALKVLRFGVGTDPESLQRFEREAQTVAKLHHTNIVPIHAIGSERAVQYFAMQFIEGQSLAGVLLTAQREGTELDPRNVARWGLQAAEALDHAHQRGVIHRDIKPSNLLLDGEGTVWLTDFGLAKQADEVTLTISGALMGTPRYMSPEQAESLSRAVDHRTDLYSLGATLYELATGRPAFDASTPHGVISQILENEPTPPRQLRPDLPRDLETIILTCLAKDPAQRYASARALADDLRAFQEARPIKTRRAGWPERTWRSLQKQKKSAAIAAIAMAASVLAVVGSLIGWQQYDAYRKAELVLKAEGPPQTAQVLQADRDEPVGPEFSVPTLQPVSLNAGSYRLKVSSPHEPSRTYQMLLDRGQKHDFVLPPFDGVLGKEVPLHEESTEQVVTEQGKLHLLEVTPWAVRRWDPQSGERVWEATFDFSPPLQAPSRTEAFDRRGKPPNASLVGPLVDLNGDGRVDFVASLREPRALFAISGQDGSALWKVPASADDSRMPLGMPVLTDVDGDGCPDLVATFGAPKTDDIWAEAISGKTSASLWRQRLEGKGHPNQVWPLSLIQRQGKTHVAVTVGSWCQVINPETGLSSERGFDLSDPHRIGAPEAGRSLPFSPRWRDLDGDGNDDALLAIAWLSRDRYKLIAASLFKRAILWETELVIPRTGASEPSLPGTTWPVLADFDGDGNSEIVVPHSAPVAGRETTEVRLLDGRTGRERWRHRLGIGGGPPRPAMYRPDAPRFVIGPDLDGDGQRELLVASLQWQLRTDLPREGPGTAWLFVDALSGKDGHQLWWQSHPISFRGDRMEAALCWNNGPGGWPHLVASLYSYSAAPELIFAPLQPGESAQLVAGLRTPRVADCDGDGLEDLVVVRQEGPLDPRHAQVLRGRPPEAWRRLGVWTGDADFDGDGLDDIISWRTKSPVIHVASGRDGRLLWSAPVACGVSPDLSPKRSGYHVLFGKWKEPWFRGWAGPGPLRVDLDCDGTPDPLVARWQLAMTRGERGRAPLPLAAISGKHGRQLWAAGKLEIGGSEPLNADVLGAAVCPGPGGEVPDLAVLYLIFDVKPDGTLQSWEQTHLALLRGESGSIVWDLPLTNRHGPQPSARSVFQHEIADLDADGKPELLFTIPNFDASDAEFEELLAVSLQTGKILWRRVLQESSVEPVSSRSVPRFEVVWPAGDRKPPSVIVIPPNNPENRMELQAFDGKSGDPQWKWSGGSDEGQPPETVALGLARLSAGESPAIIVGQGFADDRVELTRLNATGHVVEGRKIQADEVRMECADLDGDGLEEVLVEDNGKLCALRGGLREVLWAQPAGSLHAIVPAERPGPATVIAGDTFGLSGKNGERLWRTGATLSMLQNRRPGGMPRFLYRAGTPVSDGLVCTIASPVSAKGSYKPTPLPHVLRVSPGPDPRWLWPLPWSTEAGMPASVPLKLLMAGMLCLGGLVFPVWMVARTIKRKTWSLRLLLLLPVSYAVFFTAYRVALVQLPSGLSESQQRLAMVAVILGGLPVLAWLRAVGVSALRGRWRRLSLVVLATVMLAVVAAVVWLMIEGRGMANGERYSWRGWWQIWVAGAYVIGVVLLLGGSAKAIARGFQQRRRMAPRVAQEAAA